MWNRFVRWRHAGKVAAAAMVCAVGLVIVLISITPDDPVPSLPTEQAAPTTTAQLGTVAPTTTVEGAPPRYTVGCGYMNFDQQGCLGYAPTDALVGTRDREKAHAETSIDKSDRIHYSILPNFKTFWRNGYIEGQLFTPDIIAGQPYCMHRINELLEVGQSGIQSPATIANGRYKLDVPIQDIDVSVFRVDQDEHGLFYLDYTLTYNSEGFKDGPEYQTDFAFTLGLEPNKNGDYVWAWWTAGPCTPS